VVGWEKAFLSRAVGVAEGRVDGISRLELGTNKARAIAKKGFQVMLETEFGYGIDVAEGVEEKQVSNGTA